jgi:hypothetical protein
LRAESRQEKRPSRLCTRSSTNLQARYIFGIAEEEGKKWSPEQAWLLIKELAAKESLRYNELLLSDVFKSGGEKTIRALEQAELITIVSSPSGRPSLIKPGKPVYHPAFKRLTEDRVLKSRLDLAILDQLVKVSLTSRSYSVLNMQLTKP